VVVGSTPPVSCCGWHGQQAQQLVVFGGTTGVVLADQARRSVLHGFDDDDSVASLQSSLLDVSCDSMETRFLRRLFAEHVSPSLGVAAAAVLVGTLLPPRENRMASPPPSDDVRIPLVVVDGSVMSTAVSSLLEDPPSESDDDDDMTIPTTVLRNRRAIRSNHGAAADGASSILPTKSRMMEMAGVYEE
jgi:hypothetical protein